MSVCTLADCCAAYCISRVSNDAHMHDIIAIFKLPLRTPSIGTISSQSNVFAYGKLLIQITLWTNNHWESHVLLSHHVMSFSFVLRVLHMDRQMTEMKKPTRPMIIVNNKYEWRIEGVNERVLNWCTRRHYMFFVCFSVGNSEEQTNANANEWMKEQNCKSINETHECMYHGFFVTDWCPTTMRISFLISLICCYVDYCLQITIIIIIAPR